MPKLTDPFEIYNDTGTMIPLGGLCLPTGEYTDSGAQKVVKPTADSQTGLIVAIDFSIEPGEFGRGSFSHGCLLCFDPADGIPELFDRLGSQADSFYALKGNSGFQVAGGSFDCWAACVRQVAFSPLTDKGDIWIHDGTTDARFPVGDDEESLVADSGETGGLKWAVRLRGTGTADHLAKWSAVSGALADTPIEVDSGGDIFSPNNAFIDGSVISETQLQVRDPSTGVPYVSIAKLPLPSSPGSPIYYGLSAENATHLLLDHANHRVIASFGTTGAGATKYSIWNGSSISDGLTGTLGPGAATFGGVVTSLGSGSFVGTGTANVFTNTQTINSGANVPALTIQQTSSDASNTFTVRNAAGVIKFAVTGAGDVTGNDFFGNSFTGDHIGDGSGLTDLNGSEITTGTINGSLVDVIDNGTF